MALIDANGVYAAPRFFQAAKRAGIKPLVGAEVVLEDEPSLWQTPGALRPARPGARPQGGRQQPLGALDRHARPGSPSSPPTAPATATSASCSTAAARGRAKGEARVSWDLLAEHAAGLHCLTGGEEGPLARELADGGIDPARRLLERLSHLFNRRLHVELQRHRLREEEHRNQALIDLARQPPPPPRRHQRRALRPAGGQAAARRADGDPPPHHPRRRRPPPRRPPRAPPEERRRDGQPVRRSPGGAGRHAPSWRRASTSPSPTSATASPSTRCRRARRPPPICATSPGTPPAPASGRSPPGPRRRSRRSST